MKKLITLVLAVILVMSLGVTALGTGYEGDVEPINVILINADNGDVLYSKNEDDIAYCADLVKLMTAYVTVKSIEAAREDEFDEYEDFEAWEEWDDEDEEEGFVMKITAEETEA